MFRCSKLLSTSTLGFSSCTPTRMLHSSRRALSSVAVPKQLANRLAVIGCGKMAEAITGGMMQHGMQTAETVSLYDTNLPRME